MNTRRRFLAVLGVSALGVTRGTHAQQTPFRVGWISSDPEADYSPFFEAFRAGLRDLGYIEGRNLILETRWSDGVAQRTDELAADLVRVRPNVIVTQGPAAISVRKTGTSIPIVFGFSGDPIQAGLVQSLARPGGNLTGISFMSVELVGKRLELLKEVLPAAKRIAVVANSLHPGDEGEQRAAHTSATALGLVPQYFDMRGGPQLEGVLSAIQKSRSDAMLVFPMASTMRYRARFATFAVTNYIPAISGWAQFADGGNLMTYGPNLHDSFRRLATFVDKILKGAKPGELPVELPTRIELVVNRHAAKQLQVKLPESLLLRADRVIS